MDQSSVQLELFIFILRIPLLFSHTPSKMASGNATERQEKARMFVKSLAKANGHLGEDVYSTMTEETRREVEETFLSIHRIVGASIITYGTPISVYS